MPGKMNSRCSWERLVKCQNDDQQGVHRGEFLTLEHSRQAWEHAILLFRNHAWEQAILVLGHTVVQDANPPSIKALLLLNMGIITLHLGEYRQAEGLFSEAIKCADDFPITYFLYGAALFEQRQFDHARVAFQYCSSRFPESNVTIAYNTFGLDYTLNLDEVIDNEEAAAFEYAQQLLDTPEDSNHRRTLYRLPAGVLFEPPSSDIPCDSPMSTVRAVLDGKPQPSATRSVTRSASVQTLRLTSTENSRDAGSCVASSEQSMQKSNDAGDAYAVKESSQLFSHDKSAGTLVEQQSIPPRRRDELMNALRRALLKEARTTQQPRDMPLTSTRDAPVVMHPRDARVEREDLAELSHFIRHGGPYHAKEESADDSALCAVGHEAAVTSTAVSGYEQRIARPEDMIITETWASFDSDQSDLPVRSSSLALGDIQQSRAALSRRGITSSQGTHSPPSPSVYSHRAESYIDFASPLQTMYDDDLISIEDCQMFKEGDYRDEIELSHAKNDSEVLQSSSYGYQRAKSMDTVTTATTWKTFKLYESCESLAQKTTIPSDGNPQVFANMLPDLAPRDVNPLNEFIKAQKTPGSADASVFEGMASGQRMSFARHETERVLEGRDPHVPPFSSRAAWRIYQRAKADHNLGPGGSAHLHPFQFKYPRDPVVPHPATVAIPPDRAAARAALLGVVKKASTRRAKAAPRMAQEPEKHAVSCSPVMARPPPDQITARSNTRSLAASRQPPQAVIPPRPNLLHWKEKMQNSALPGDDSPPRSVRTMASTAIFAQGQRR